MTRPQQALGHLSDSDQHNMSEELGSHEVFEILAADHADMLVCYLRTLVARGDVVDDLFQETMVTAWDKLPTFDRTRPFGPWLRGIARNKVLQHRDRNRRDVLRCDSEVLERLEESFAMLPQRDGFREAVDTLRACMNQLPDKMRLAIELVYRRGLRMRRAADRLGASEEAVKKRVQRGRSLLANCLRNGGAMA